GHDMRRTTLQQAVREPPGRGTHVQRLRALDAQFELGDGVTEIRDAVVELVPAAGNKARRGIHSDLVAISHLRGRLVHPLSVDPHAPSHDESLRDGPRLSESCFHHVLVDADCHAWNATRFSSCGRWRLARSYRSRSCTYRAMSDKRPPPP